MGAFFKLDEFAVVATFTPAGGASVSANVLFDAQTEAMFGDETLSNEYTITYPVTALVGIKKGDRGTVDGKSYRVREVRLKDDGRLVVAALSRV